MGASALAATRPAAGTDTAGLKKLARPFAPPLLTANVALDQTDSIARRKLSGRLHPVGAVPEPIPVLGFPLLLSHQSLGASPTGSRAQIAKMLRFCALHDSKPLTEHLPMREANAAPDHLRAGKAHYRIVLGHDL